MQTNKYNSYAEMSNNVKYLCRTSFEMMRQPIQQLEFDSAAEMDQLLDVIYEAATGQCTTQRQLYAELCHLLKDKKTADQVTLKHRLLKKCQASFNLILEGSSSQQAGVVQFIGELFNVAIFPASILVGQCIEQLLNRRLKQGHQDGLFHLHALLMTVGERLETELEQNPTRYPFSMQQCIQMMEEAAAKPNQPAASDVEGQQCGGPFGNIHLIDELKTARQKKWIPFLQAMKMKQWAKDNYQQVNLQKLQEYNLKVDDMNKRLKAAFLSKAQQKQSV